MEALTKNLKNILAKLLKLSAAVYLEAKETLKGKEVKREPGRPRIFFIVSLHGKGWKS